MAIIKCKMCGGDLHFEEGASICECEYCGNTNTLPIVSSDQEMNLFNRANHFRMINEFDKAISAYEKILDTDDTNAEAHWGIVLSRYGIEYVEDPVSHERIPTCHRVQLTSILSDPDYLAAVEHADSIASAEYKVQAERIAQIQKGILAISSKEKPYDVFICYKETDDSGRRTVDSTLAQDIYYGLTESGYRVFFSRITLEDKLGQEYEPYIFAALNSAKVMVVVGTKPEYYNAVWVKNEWSRYLDLMKNNRHRLLIPCYRDMDPYDLPDELSMLQSQDMSRIGFMQDLIRGIKKVIVKEETATSQKGKASAESFQENTYTGNVSALLKRGDMALEDREWKKADGFYEDVLNQNAECAEAYAGKLLASKQMSTLEAWFQGLKDKNKSKVTHETVEACPADTQHIQFVSEQYAIPDYLSVKEISDLYTFDRSYASSQKCRESQLCEQMAELSGEKLYARAKQYAKGEMEEKLTSLEADLKQTLEARVETAQKQDEEQTAAIKSAYKRHIAQADEKVKQLYEAAEAKREQDYQAAVSDATNKKQKTVSEYERIIRCFKMLGDYKDSAKHIGQCQQEISRIRAEEKAERDRKQEEQKREAAERAGKTKRNMIIGATLVAVAVAVAVLYFVVLKPRMAYSSAMKLMKDGRYEEAITAFEELGDYSDAAEQAKELAYQAAGKLYEAGNYEEALSAYSKLRGYKDVDDLLDSDEKLLKAAYTGVGNIVTFGSYEQDNDTSNGAEPIEWIVLDSEDGKSLLISKYALDTLPYDTKYSNVTWETCSLRGWLNEDFLETAFTEEKQGSIIDSEINNANNSRYGTEGGKDTTDKIFLLSKEEAETYFSSDEERMCAPTEYAIAQGAWTSDDHRTAEGEAACVWWLRSPGGNCSFAARVSTDGFVNDLGRNVNDDSHCVRPALWINLDSGLF